MIALQENAYLFLELRFDPSNPAKPDESSPAPPQGDSPGTYFDDQVTHEMCYCALVALGRAFSSLPANARLSRQYVRVVKKNTRSGRARYGELAPLLEDLAAGSPVDSFAKGQIDTVLSAVFDDFLDVWTAIIRDGRPRLLEGETLRMAESQLPPNLWGSLSSLEPEPRDLAIGLQRLIDYVFAMGDLHARLDGRPYNQSLLLHFHEAFGPTVSEQGKLLLKQALDAFEHPDQEARTSFFDQWNHGFEILYPLPVYKLAALPGRPNVVRQPRSLTIKRSRISSENLEQSVESPQGDSELSAVILEGCALEPNSLDPLSKFTNLKRLVLSRCHLTGTYVEILSSLNNIKDLEIEDESLTDDRALELMELPNRLDSLTLLSSQLSSDVDGPLETVHGNVRRLPFGQRHNVLFPQRAVERRETEELLTEEGGGA